jgi:hypothetical protein
MNYTKRKVNLMVFNAIIITVISILLLSYVIARPMSRSEANCVLEQRGTLVSGEGHFTYYMEQGPTTEEYQALYTLSKVYEGSFLYVAEGTTEIYTEDE